MLIDIQGLNATDVNVESNRIMFIMRNKHIALKLRLYLRNHGYL